MNTLQVLQKERSQSTSLVSFILKAGADKKTATALIDHELHTASNIKSKSTRDEVTHALKAIGAELSEIKIPDNGIAMYAGQRV